jgi:hypothetical protein
VEKKSFYEIFIKKCPQHTVKKQQKNAMRESRARAFPNFRKHASLS